MKIRVSEMRLIGDGMRDLLVKELPIKTAYWIKRFVNRLDSQAKIVERSRVNLAIEYARKDENGKPLMEKDKDGKDINKFDIVDKVAFDKKYLELMKSEFEIDFEPIRLSDLEGETCEKCGKKKGTIKPLTLINLEKVIMDDFKEVSKEGKVVIFPH